MNDPLLYDPTSDAPGVAEGTELWMDGGDYMRAEELYTRFVIGEPLFVLGVAFRNENVYVPALAERGDRSSGIRTARRPYVGSRRVTSVRRIIGRAWQVTYGPRDAESQARRLVCGADTHLLTGTLTHDDVETTHVHRLHTACDNPREGSGVRTALDVRVEGGEAYQTPAPVHGTPKGDLIATIPAEAYFAERGALRTDVRPHRRYTYTQVREVTPVADEAALYVIEVEPDRDENGTPTRANLIAQTPFNKERQQRRVLSDPRTGEALSDPVGFSTSHTPEDADDTTAWRNRWRATKQSETLVESTRQGTYWELAGQKGEAYQQKYGFRTWLNGGILIELPVAVEAPAPAVDIPVATRA